MDDIKQKGVKGEDEIVKLLNNKGLNILDRNYNSRFGEIDIIAVNKQKSKVLFIEVKNVSTQIEDDFPIKQNQIRKIVSTSRFWLAENNEYSDLLYEFWGVIILPNKGIKWFELLEF